MESAIASAVVLPEDLVAVVSPPRSSKRRHSSVSNDDTKRSRPNDEAETVSHHPSSKTNQKSAAPARREKGRERRLFGAVLGALSQNPTTAAQTRRTEIEKRQLAQRRIDTEESEQRRSERAARRKAQRWKEHERFERQAMCLRHDNLLNTAHFLRTETEPYLYYKPWETSAEEDERIRSQIAEARKTIEQQTYGYEVDPSREDRDKEHARPSPEVMSSRASNDHGDKQHDKTTSLNDNSIESTHSSMDMNTSNSQPIKQPETRTSATADSIKPAQADSLIDHTDLNREIDKGRQDDDNNGEDVIEEAAEDTVIY